MKYSIDTSCLIHAFRRAYPPDIAPGFWRILEEAIAAGMIQASEVVAHELEQSEKETDKEKAPDDLYRWAKNQHGFFVPIDGPIQQSVRNILSVHPRLVVTSKSKGSSGGDPFVIALAQQHGAAVVTQETRNVTKNTLQARPGIVDVCDALDIKTFNLIALLREEKWRI